MANPTLIIFTNKHQFFKCKRIQNVNPKIEQFIVEMLVVSKKGFELLH